MTQELAGPFSYAKWKMSYSESMHKWIFEHPLYTDAHIVGELREELGPYQIINALGMGSARPALFLRSPSNTDYTLPQMERTKVEFYHGGDEKDEIAALLSLCLGIRLKAGNATRIFDLDDDPKGRPTSWHMGQDPDIGSMRPRSKKPILKNAIGRHDINEEAQILTTFPNLDVNDVIALVRAARMYQEAVWIIEVTPELSWLMLTSAIEIIAHRWRTTNESPVERMRTSRPTLEPILQAAGGDELVQKVAEEIALYMGATKTFIDFILDHLPPEPPLRPPTSAQHNWTKPAIKKTLELIYNYRSKALHSGIPFPAPMCEPPVDMGENGELAEKPVGSTGMKGAVWVAKDTPMLLHTFEYIVRNSILKWWKETASKSPDLAKPT